MNAFLSEADRIALTDEIPFRSFRRPEEVAELVLDLAQKHSYLTGQIIGWMADGFDAGIEKISYKANI